MTTVEKVEQVEQVEKVEKVARVGLPLLLVSPVPNEREGASERPADSCRPPKRVFPTEITPSVIFQPQFSKISAQKQRFFNQLITLGVILQVRMVTSCSDAAVRRLPQHLVVWTG